MSRFLRQSTASQGREIGPFLDDTDFKTAETALTIANTDIKLVVNGAASANKNSGGGTHRVNGHYGVTFDATDTGTVGEMTVSVVVAGALPVFATFTILEEAVYDALFVAAAPGYVTDQPVNATKIGGTSQTGRDLGASVLISSGSGTGQLDVTSGVIKASLAQILGTAFTEGASGRIAAAFKQFFNIATPAATMDHGVLVDTVTTLTNAPSDSSGVTTLLSRVPSGIFTGITSLAQWLGLLAGKQTGNSTARTELRATGGGSGTFDETTDSLEAVRDRGDAAYTTVGAAAIRSALGLASANLDTQLDALPTAAENADAVWEEAIADHSGTSGSTAEALNAAGSAGDPWVTALPGAYSAGQAGYIVGNNLDAPVSGVPTANENADALLDRSNGVETSLTPRGTLRLMLAALAGKLSGAAGTTVTIRNVGDSKDRITATVDADGNRTAVSTDAT